MSERLFKMEFDCGRMGTVYGLFVADEDKVNTLIKSGVEVYFGEVLGKHSEVSGPLEKQDIEAVDLDAETVQKVTAVLGKTWSGHNPFSNIDGEEAWEKIIEAAKDNE